MVRVDPVMDGPAVHAIRTLLAHPKLNRFNCVRQVHYPVNQTVIHEGSHCGKLYLIDSGQLRILSDVALDDCRQIKPGIADLGPGELVGELAMFDGEAHAASVITLSEAELTEIDTEAFMHFMDSHPELGYPVLKALIETLISRFRKTNRKVSSLFAWGLKAHRIDRHL